MPIKKTQQEKLESFFDSLNKEIVKNGSKSIKVKTLVKNFGYSKRSIQNIMKINDELKSRGLFAQPEYSMDLKFESILRISSYPVKQLGDLFSSEKQLEDFFDTKKLYKKLDIKSVERQYSPNGSKDRLDFRGITEEGEVVVLELKNFGGGKSAVEQVLRYTGLLKLENSKSKIRTVLVTGIQNYETTLAINGMTKTQRKSFEWYLYKFDKSSNKLDLIRLSDEDFK
ncbi:endonuclease NucS domain-containing protein [Chryseobacterium turcicum]|uniref:Endonuclease NucS n=1 Tax=Chryseobacterium turcicum TaxID=2898076 RepID=A0A9Q3V6G4_9FLAO|nr:endonuclease NucS domain-containing protein [Chryseobacterium turcicum]MCD1119132.1 endonuclease NucS [Chryseobacterium turcicum]